MIKVVVENIKIFCTSVKKVGYFDNFFPTIQMVGLGDNAFPDSWIKTDNKKNISNKFYSYADLIAQYYVWKNLLDNYDEKQWIGFSQYRRFWLKHKISKTYPLNSIDDLILTEPDLSWKNYDAIIPAPFYFKKKIKDLKNIFSINSFKDINFFKYRITVEKQFRESLGNHGAEIISDIIKLLPDKDQVGFKEFLANRNHLSAHGMYISRKNIIKSYSEFLFSWFEKCEGIINRNNDLPLLQNRRIFQYINERFLDYWMNKNVKTLCWPIAMYNSEKKIITSIGKI